MSSLLGSHTRRTRIVYIRKYIFFYILINCYIYFNTDKEHSGLIDTCVLINFTASFKSAWNKFLPNISKKQGIYIAHLIRHFQSETMCEDSFSFGNITIIFLFGDKINGLQIFHVSKISDTCHLYNFTTFLNRQSEISNKYFEVIRRLASVPDETSVSRNHMVVYIYFLSF